MSDAVVEGAEAAEGGFCGVGLAAAPHAVPLRSPLVPLTWGVQDSTPCGAGIGTVASGTGALLAPVGGAFVRTSVGPHGGVAVLCAAAFEAGA